MNAAHSKLGASGMYRWAKCPGSVREIANAPAAVESEYAREGTHAHALAARCLTGGTNSGMWIGKTFNYDGLKFKVDREMAEAVQVYIDAVDAHPGDMQVEQRFDLSSIHSGCFGTADCVIWQEDTATLVVIDYKHGAGIPVEVRNNPQLLYYGLGALISSNRPVVKVKLVIVQPRCDHADGPVRSWEIDALELMDFAIDLKSYAVATEDPKAPLVSGDHCRFCPAAKDCPALERRSQELAKAEFSAVLSYDPKALSDALHAMDAIEAKIKAVREFAYAEAEAGRCAPGWKLVAKRARRKWRDEGEVIATFQDTLGDDLFEPRAVKSPAQLEKAIGKETVAQYAIAESSGHVLVPESDKRPAVKLLARDEFTAV